MTTISVTNNVMTLITVYEVAPADQQHLIELITTAYEQTIRHLPGFVEAHAHRSSDGVRVVSYAQWNGQASYGNPDSGLLWRFCSAAARSRQRSPQRDTQHQAPPGAAG